MSTQDLPQTSTDRVALLYHLSRTFNSSLNLDEVLNNVMDEVISATRAQRGFVVLRQEDGELVFPVARGLNHTDIDFPQWQVSHGVIDGVLSDGEPLITNDAQDDLRFEGMQSVTYLGLTSIMCAPLVVRGEIIGALYVENRTQSGIFMEDDMDMLTTIASSAAISIENARLYGEAVDKGRMERELQVARNVQRDFLPREIYQPTGWEIGAHLEAAREVGGDFYDVFSLDEDRLVGLVIGDVCDKGVGSALFMALSRSLIRAFSEQHICLDGRLAKFGEMDETDPKRQEGKQSGGDPTDVSTLVNTVYLTNQYMVNHHQASNMFTTLFFAVIDPATGWVNYVNSGHEPPILLGKEGIKSRLDPTGPVLGIIPDMEFRVNHVVLEPGDILLAFTDGVIDALDPEGQPFSEERLLSLVQPPADSAIELLRRISSALKAHMGDRAQFDDITLLAARWNGKA